jgi:hypothetical protein
MSSLEEAARQRRSEAALRYKPALVKLLLIAEAPPSALDRYFYFEDVRDKDSLFRYVAKAVLSCEPSRTNKAQLLGRLMDAGVQLIDLKTDPVIGGDRADLHRYVPALVDRCLALAPQRIILIKANVYDLVFRPLRATGLPVIDVKVPFPGSGRQREFEQRFADALALCAMDGTNSAARASAGRQPPVT